MNATENRSMGEISVRNDGKSLPKFPEKCPSCGASKVVEKLDNYFGGALYGCGGGYVPKSQIQNHTNKWWGVCAGLR